MAIKSSNVKLLIPYDEPLYSALISDTIENTNKFKLGRKVSVRRNKRSTDIITLLPLRIIFVPLPYYSPRSVSSFYPSPYSTFNVWWCLASHTHRNCLVYHFPLFMSLRTVPSSLISPVSSCSSSLPESCHCPSPACSSTALLAPRHVHTSYSTWFSSGSSLGLYQYQLLREACSACC